MHVGVGTAAGTRLLGRDEVGGQTENWEEDSG